ncbi:MAG: hypothetical protein M9921_07345 [Fimbriimonadaceae bacterium]|nr:hypothetical protein [Chthonomonadaceae bacterium]MCO5296655.1 hypothetical protein [Fimbriimonadaceae bacterium]
MDDLRERALRLAEGQAATPSSIERVAAATSPEAARWAFTQWELRKRGSAKFGQAGEMLFVREALEQATHEALAAYHASRFPQGELVADLTCGIGADLVALAARGPAVGFELDAERAACARHNLAVHGLSAEVHEQDSFGAEWSWEYAAADPARRAGGRRLRDPEAFEPDPRSLAERMGALRLGMLKLSPMLADTYLESLGGALEFVSFGGECREALVWLGQLATPGRWAVLVESGERLAAGEPPFPVDGPDAVVCEADPAAIRAHALGTLCEQHALTPLGDSNGYLTGASPPDSPWLRSYRVLARGAWDLKALRSLLAERRCRTPEIKVRGCPIDVEKTRRSLRADGSEPAVVLSYPVGKQIRYALGLEVR